MIPENSKSDIEKQRQSIIEEIEVLKTHSQLLSEVMVNAKESVLNEKAGMHLREGNEDAYQLFLHKIYKTEASIVTCQAYIEDCTDKIRSKEEKLKHFNILLDQQPPSTSFNATA